MQKPWLMEIESVSGLVEFAEEHCTSSRLFRGQPQDKALLPKIARGSLKSNFLAHEQHLLHEFKLRSAPYLDAAVRDDWDWLAIAQHYGMATRLLDWTANPLAALWFAVKNGPHDSDDGVVWMFPYEDDDVAEQDAESPFEGMRTKIFQPKHLTRTIVAQSGWFTVHKYMTEEQDFVPFERNKLYKRECEKCRIRSGNFFKLKSQLDRIGINDSTMFPNLGGLCDYLNFVHLPRLVVQRFPRLQATNPKEQRDDKGD